MLLRTMVLVSCVLMPLAYGSDDPMSECESPLKRSRNGEVSDQIVTNPLQYENLLQARKDFISKLIDGKAELNLDVIEELDLTMKDKRLLATMYDDSQHAYLLVRLLQEGYWRPHLFLSRQRLAIRNINIRANRGNVLDIFTLGLVYLNGLAKSKDCATNQCHQCRQGKRVQGSAGVPICGDMIQQDFSFALEQFIRSAHKGCQLAYRPLVEIYMSGQGYLKKDDIKTKTKIKDAVQNLEDIMLQRGVTVSPSAVPVMLSDLDFLQKTILPILSKYKKLIEFMSVSDKDYTTGQRKCQDLEEALKLARYLENLEGDKLDMDFALLRKYQEILTEKIKNLKKIALLNYLDEGLEDL